MTRKRFLCLAMAQRINKRVATFAAIMTKNNEWILIGSKLPKPDTKVLVTKKDNNGDNYVVSAQYWNDHRFHTLLSDGNLYDITDSVIAWQPFPKPHYEK